MHRQRNMQAKQTLLISSLVTACLFSCGCTTQGASSSAEADWPELIVPIEAVRPIAPMKLSVVYKVMDGPPLSTLILRIAVDKDGNTKRVGLLQSSGHPNLDESAIDSAWRAVYQPYVKDGERVAFTIVTPITLK